MISCNDMQRILTSFIFILLSWWTVTGQDDVLFTIDGIPVFLEEFERTYNKNNNLPGYENMPVEEYLEMYINFKLKVTEAQRLGYDTMTSFVNEFAGYREQLAKPYLQDKQVIEQLVEEAYERSVIEVNASHIMMLLPDYPSPEDTLHIYRKIMGVRDRLIKGEPFEAIAMETSEDPSVGTNQGNLGWFFAFTMVYPFEDAAYKTDVGEISLPVRTQYGYHIIKVNNRRKALGEIKLAHIMIRAGINESDEIVNNARDRIDRCYDLINQGSDFGEVARMVSEDAGSSANNGQMQWLRSGQLPSDIEEQVFILKDSGDFTQPLRSVYGWHIFQLIDRRPLGSFDEMRAQLEEKVMADQRILISEEAIINKIKTQSGFIKYADNVEHLLQLMDSSVYLGQWNPMVLSNLIEPVFAIGEKEYLQKDLADHIANTAQYSKNESLQNILHRKCEELIQNELIEFRKQRLEEEYPDYKYLLKEYHDGILLFNISDDLIWKRAVQDSAGLNEFYQDHQSDYMWGERADLSIYTLDDSSYLDKIHRFAKKKYRKNWSDQELMQIVCGNDSDRCVSIENVKYEKGENQMAGQIRWKKGAVQEIHHENGIQVIFLNAILPPEPKQIHEARGVIVSDYQDYLDRQWVEELRSKYSVKVNEEVLNKLIL